jgi:diketogulonate reductase-like aldo/keto reductase
MHKSTVALVAQISTELQAFFEQPTETTFMVAVSNARQVFDALSGWMSTSPPSSVEMDDGAAVGVPFLYGGQSMRILADPGAGPGDAKVRLANGVEMPVLGFGTWQLDDQACYEATMHALKVGYRHIDTAQGYGNEGSVGLALSDSGIPRRQVFLVTKLSDQGDYEPEALVRAFKNQLRALQTNYIDLYMLHSPGSTPELTRRAWEKLEELYRSGKIRALGVSNFNMQQLQELIDSVTIPPVYVQNKFSIYSPGEQQVNNDAALMSYLRGKGIVMMGYSVINPWPFIMPPMEDPHVLAIADRLGKSPSQVLHRWALQLGAGVIPKSGNPARIEENSKLFDFALSEVDMRLLSGLVTLSESTVSAVKPAWMEDVYDLGVGVRAVK